MRAGKLGGLAALVLLLPGMAAASAAPLENGSNGTPSGFNSIVLQDSRTGEVLRIRDLDTGVTHLPARTPRAAGQSLGGFESIVFEEVQTGQVLRVLDLKNGTASIPAQASLRPAKPCEKLGCFGTVQSPSSPRSSAQLLPMTAVFTG